MIWRYSESENWHITSLKTPILYSGSTIQLSGKGFRWPSWAIEMVNNLGGNSNAIQTVSKLLENERKENAVSN